VPGAGVVHVSVKEGHFEEFYHDVSTFIYCIISGSGTFYLNDEPVEAKSEDLIVTPPKTRIHYLGTMEMVLITTPAWSEEREHHVRMIEGR